MSRLEFGWLHVNSINVVFSSRRKTRDVIILMFMCVCVVACDKTGKLIQLWFLYLKPGFLAVFLFIFLILF